MNAKNNELKTLKGQVLHCLKRYPQTRDCDKELTIVLWRRFYSEHITIVHTGFLADSECVKLPAIVFLPSQDAIKRIRAHIQNTLKQYPPASWKVAKGRGWLERDWQKALGYYVEPKGQQNFLGELL